MKAFSIYGYKRNIPVLVFEQTKFTFLIIKHYYFTTSKWYKWEAFQEIPNQSNLVVQFNFQKKYHSHGYSNNTMNQLAKLLIFIYVAFVLTNETEQQNGLNIEVSFIFILPYKGPGVILNSKDSPYVLVKSHLCKTRLKTQRFNPLCTLVWAIFKP